MTKEEISRAKELDLLTYFKLVEPGNLKLVGKEYRHKVHSSLTISKNSLWCWHCIGLRGRTALKYLIDVEKVLCRGCAGDQPPPRRCGSFFPTCKPAAAAR